MSLIWRLHRAFLSLALVCFSVHTIAATPIAKNGVLDLQQWQLQDTIALSGEFEFYWQQHLVDEDFDLTSQSPSKLIYVPGNWKNETLGEAVLPGEGHATYRLKILLPKTASYAIKVPDIGTSYRLYVDGQQLAEAGTAGKTRESTTPAYAPTIVEFTPKARLIELVIHVSNFDYRVGGIWLPLHLGSPEQIHKMTENQRALDLLLVGAIVILGFYTLALFLMRPEDRSSLFLAAFCLLLAIRLTTVGERYLTEIADLSFDWYVRIEYLSWILAVSAFAGFMNCVLPREFNRWLAYVAHLLVGAGALIILLSPVATFTAVVVPFQAITILYMAIGSVSFALAIRHKQEGALILTLAYAVLFYAVVNDILVNAAVINSILMLDIGILVFIFFQSTLISYRFTRSFNMIESQRASLQAANLRLRTQEKLRQAADHASEELRKRNAASEKMAVIESLVQTMRFRIDSFLEMLEGQPAGKVLQDLVLITSAPEQHVESINLNKLIETEKESGAKISTKLDSRIPNIVINKALAERLISGLIDYFEAHTKGLSLIETYNEACEDQSLFFNDIDAGNYVVLSISCGEHNNFEASQFENLFDAAYVVNQHVEHETGLGLTVVSTIVKESGGGVDLLVLNNGGVRLEVYLPTPAE